MDNFPVTCSSLARFFHIKGSTLERNYKLSLSDFGQWDQKEHSADWVLLAKNLGEYDSIDETTIGDDVYTILSNKAGHGGKGTIVAVVKGTKAEVVSRILKMIPLSEREKVKEVTMDFSDSMYAIVRECFPNATIVIDCFHIVQRLCEALDEMRLRFKRLAVTATKKEEVAWKKSEDAKAKRRAYGRTKYAVKKAGKKKPKGKKRGRKRIGRKKYRPSMLSNGDTLVELLTRGKYVLAKSGEKWGKHQKERAHLLFELYPKLREAYSLICTIRAMFRNKKLTREAARGYLHNWYEKVNACTIREVKSARDCIKAKEEEVINYFKERHSNASAESLNSKIKGFRAQVHGVADVPFFMYRLCTIFG